MKTEEYVSAIKNMQAFSDLVGSIYPDEYKFVCQQHDIPEREAMDMYGYLRKIACGQYWCVDDKRHPCIGTDRYSCNENPNIPACRHNRALHRFIFQ